MVRATVSLAVVLAVAAVFGCTPTPAEREAVMMPELDNGSFSADLGGCAIHYEVHGQGPVVMTVPNSWGLSLAGLRGFPGATGDISFEGRGEPVRALFYLTVDKSGVREMLPAEMAAPGLLAP